MSETPSFWSSLLAHLHIARALRGLRIRLDREKCRGDWSCYEVCPVGCWRPDLDAQKISLVWEERCIACGACVLQCPTRALALC